MHELLDEVTADTRKSIMAAKPKILSCVRLSDVLRNGTYYLKLYKNKSNIVKNKQPSYTRIKKLPKIDQREEFIMSDMIFDKQFSTLNTAKRYIQDMKTWSYVSTGYVKNPSATVDYYRCNLVSDAGVPCPVKNYLLSESASAVLLYRNTMHHGHDTIDQIFDNETNKQVDDDDDDIYLASFDAIKMWLSSITKIPKDHHTVYCVDYILDRELKVSKFFLTTRQLLKTVLDSNSIHVTSLGKLQWNKLGIILIGTTDFNQKFHHFGVAICDATTASDYEFIFSSIQKGVTECYPNATFTIDTLLSDCNPAIQNAFKYVFGIATKTVTCVLDFKTKISKLFENKNFNAMEDILRLQRLPSVDVFNVGVQLFLNKWDMGNIGQFKTEWLDENCNWYEGYSSFTPSNNIAILTEYEQFGRAYFYKSFDALDLFMDQLFLAVKNWSMSYNSGYKYSKKPIKSRLLDDVCQWLRQPKNIEKEIIGIETIYYLKVNNSSRGFRQELFKLYRGNEFNTLDDFFQIRSKYYTVRRNQQNVIFCDCAKFFDYFMCRHSIGIEFLLNLYKIPLSLIPNPSDIPYYLKLDQL